MCHFPFKYNGKTFYECTTEGGWDKWCAYRVKSNLEEKDWEYCSDFWPEKPMPNELQVHPSRFEVSLKLYISSHT